MDSSGRELESFLREQRGRGVIDSSGEFTVNANKALEKLASSRFTEIAFWIVKFVQFATVSEASEMRTVIEENVTRATLMLPEGNFSLPDLLFELRKPQPDRGSKYHHLAIALRCLVGAADHCFALHFGPSCLLWDQSTLGMTELSEAEMTPGLTLEVTAELSGLTRGLARRARETHLLTSSALTAPFPIVLDGRLIDFSNLEPSKYYSQTLEVDFVDHAEGCRLPAALTSLASHLDQDSRRVFSAKSSRVDLKVGSFWYVNYNYEVHHRPFSFSPYPMPRPGASYVFWVKDGVILQTLAFPKRFPFSVQIFLCADRCATDLSECRLLVNQEYEELKASLPALLGRITDDLDKKLFRLEQLGQGRVLGGWDVVKGTAQHMLKGLSMGEWIADQGGRYCSLPQFRRKLLTHLKVQRVNFRGLSVSELSSFL